MVSSKKNKLTSAAGINLGAIVTKTNGIATHKIHIRGTIIKSLSKRAKLSINNKAKVATNSLPTTAAEDWMQLGGSQLEAGWLPGSVAGWPGC